MATRTWVGSISEDWTDAANWLDGVPQNGDDIAFTNDPPTDQFRLVIPENGMTFGSLNLDYQEAKVTIDGNTWEGFVNPVDNNYLGDACVINGGVFLGVVQGVGCVINGGQFNSIGSQGGNFNGGTVSNYLSAFDGLIVSNDVVVETGCTVQMAGGKEIVTGPVGVVVTEDAIAAGETATFRATAYDADNNPLFTADLEVSAGAGGGGTSPSGGIVNNFVFIGSGFCGG